MLGKDMEERFKRYLKKKKEKKEKKEKERKENPSEKAKHQNKHDLTGANIKFQRM